VTPPEGWVVLAVVMFALGLLLGFALGRFA
jgi:hypothetical protein